MNPHTTPTAQLTIPTTGAQTQGVGKPDTADPTCSCPSQANTALTTDGFKDGSETAAQQGEGVAAAITGDEAQPVEGDTQPKKAVKESKASEWYHDDDVSQDAQSGSLDEVEERLRKEVGAQAKGEEAGEAKKTT
ncbi:hypothetical protein FHL15_001270 [Xylaria flabelliformis]|uniref:Uncharacterized protein n=1 Tax=Xylaria flabelliformis TaxID=2512241 RepID=A0A553ICY8_9PEZI|nr:hypothetical protein FHL15_001270 [Xylaria flabelliformis]